MVASICGIAGAPAGAEFVDFGDNSFVKKIGRPVTISVHQEFSGFTEELLRRDADSEVVRTSEGWSPFWDADVWVFFLKDADSIKRLGNLEQHIEKLSSALTNEIFVKRIDVDLKSGKTVLVKFVNVASMDKQNYSEVGCRAAASLYYDLVGQTEGSGLAEAFEECKTTQ